MIDWMAFVIVFLASLIAAVLVVSLYGLGIKLLATPTKGSITQAEGAARDAEDDDVNTTGRPRLATVGAYACFTLCAIAVLYGIYLIVPALHG